MTTEHYAALTSTYDYYQEVYEMFSGNRDAQYEVYRLDQVNRMIARLEDELEIQRQEARQRLDSLLELDKNIDDNYALHTLVYETCLYDGDRLMPIRRHNHQSPLTTDHWQGLRRRARAGMEQIARRRTISRSLSPAPTCDVTTSPPSHPPPPPPPPSPPLLLLLLLLHLLLLPLLPLLL
jgi:hypothetical protein